MPHLSEEELLKLYIRNKQGDDRAREKLASYNLPLVHSICRRYPPETVEYDDIFQEGCIGLLQALKKYDPSRGTKFSTYAVPFILGMIRSYLRQNGHLLKVPRSYYAHFRRLLKERDDLEQVLKRRPRLEEIAQKTGLTKEEIIWLLDLQYPVLPLKEADKSEALTAGVKNQFMEQDMIFNKLFLQEKLNVLPPRERQVIVLRFFLEKSQAEVARILDLSQKHISRLEKKALGILKEK
ncbi:MAG: sigma-70 family RNA polymerase sigma factor [Firmicutes bacterium]|nr:sigma-70 family RNA polymerase sigma factor [Bacillota bacterium]